MAYTDKAWYVRNNSRMTVFDMGSSSNSSGATLTLTNFDFVVPAGALIVVCVNELGAGGAGTVSDNAPLGANTYTLATSEAIQGGGALGQIFYAYNVNPMIGNRTVTYTKQTTGDKAGMSVFCVTGALTTSGVLDTAVTAAAASNTASPTVTGGTPGQAGELMVGCTFWDAAASITFTDPSGWIGPPDNQQGQPNAALAGGYWINPNSTAATFAPTLSAPENQSTIVVGFKGASAPTGWSAVAPWTTGATPACGAIIRQAGPVAIPNGGSAAVTGKFCFICIHNLSGTTMTGATEPSWVTTRGGQTTDNTNIKWAECTGQASLNGDLTNTPNWTAIKNTAVSIGQIIQNGAGTLLLMCTTAGTAGNGSEPTWAAYTTAGATTTDNTITWTTLGAPATYTIWNAPAAAVGDLWYNVTNWGVAGNSHFLAADHAEGIFANAGSGGWQSLPTSASAFTKIMCCAVAPSTTPPSASDITTGAIVSWATSGNFQFGGGSNDIYINGVAFSNNSGDLIIAGGSGGGAGRMTFENCTFAQTVGGYIQLGDEVWFNNCTITNLGTGLKLFTRFFWRNSPSALPANAGTLFSANNGGECIVFDGVDCSSFTGTVLGSQGQPCIATFRRCKFGTGCTVYASGTTESSEIADVIDCYIGTTWHPYDRHMQGGDMTTSSVVTRTGGANVNGTPVSWACALNATYLDPTVPFDCPSIGIYNATTGSPVAVNVYGIINAAAVPTSIQAWTEVEYHGSASNSFGYFASSGWVNPQSSGSNLSADTSAWDSEVTAWAATTAATAGTSIMTLGNGQVYFCTTSGTTGSVKPTAVADGSNTASDNGVIWRAGCRFVINQSVTPQMAGQINIKTRLGGPLGKTIYIDPQAVL